MGLKLMLGVCVCQIFIISILAADTENECGFNCCAHYFREYGICTACKNGTYRFRDDDNSVCKPCPENTYGYLVLNFANALYQKVPDHGSKVTQNDRSVPAVIIQKSSYTVFIGSPVTLVCNVSTRIPINRVYWQRNTGDNIVTLNVTSDDGNYIGSTTTMPSLTILNAGKDDEGAYTCFAANSIGLGQSSPTLLVVSTQNDESNNTWYFISIGVVIVVLVMLSKPINNARKKCIRRQISQVTTENVSELYHEYQYIDENRIEDMSINRRVVTVNQMEMAAVSDGQQGQGRKRNAIEIASLPANDGYLHPIYKMDSGEQSITTPNLSDKNNYADDGNLKHVNPPSNDVDNNGHPDNEYLHPYNPLLKVSTQNHDYDQCNMPKYTMSNDPSEIVKRVSQEKIVVKCNVFADTPDKADNDTSSNETSTHSLEP